MYKTLPHFALAGRYNIIEYSDMPGGGNVAGNAGHGVI
jgi:hypothetical protein